MQPTGTDKIFSYRKIRLIIHCESKCVIMWISLRTSSWQLILVKCSKRHKKKDLDYSDADVDVDDDSVIKRTLLRTFHV